MIKGANGGGVGAVSTLQTGIQSTPSGSSKNDHFVARSHRRRCFLLVMLKNDLFVRFAGVNWPNAMAFRMCIRTDTA